MSFAATVANDYKITDVTETITLKDRSGNTIATVQFADPHTPGFHDIDAMQGMIGFGDTIWILGRNQLAAGVQPLEGWQIVQASGQIWLLTGNAELDSFNISWRCPSVKKR